jgi:HK97 family phage prohead protease
MSRLEYGRSAPILTVGGHAVTQRKATQTKASRSNLGLVIEGVALHYNQVIYHDLRFQCICPTAFDVGLKYESPVQFWIGHNEKLHLKNCKLELHSTETELNFRLHLDDSEIAFHARDLVESKAYTEVSIGYHSSSYIDRKIGDKTVKFIVRAILGETSLVPAGKCKVTHAQISELHNCRSLRDDVESKKFSSDNKFAELRRTLNRLENQNA